LPQTVRPTDPEFAPGHSVKFADGYPLLVSLQVSCALHASAGSCKAAAHLILLHVLCLRPLSAFKVQGQNTHPCTTGTMQARLQAVLASAMPAVLAGKHHLERPGHSCACSLKSAPEASDVQHLWACFEGPQQPATQQLLPTL
jgi:hypothetical protein